MNEIKSKRTAQRMQRERQQVQQLLEEIEEALMGAPAQAELLEELHRVSRNSSPGEAKELLASVQRVLAPLQ